MSDIVVRKCHVYEAINRVKLRLASGGGITKDREAPAGGAGKYAFRGIDDMFNVLCQITAEEGLCMIPRVVDSRVEYQTSAKGTPQTHVFLTVEVDFVSAVDGSMHTGRFIGEALDTSDKACNKAMSAAFKYAHIQPFQIPTHGESDDTENHHIPVAPARGPGPAKAAPPAAKSERAVEPAATSATTNEFAGAAHNASTFGVLLAVAKEAHVAGADPATWSVIRKRCLEMIIESPDLKTLKESKEIVRELGSSEALVRAVNLRYTALNTTAAS